MRTRSTQLSELPAINFSLGFGDRLLMNGKRDRKKPDKALKGFAGLDFLTDSR
jgi:hypothetical protein